MKYSLIIFLTLLNYLSHAQDKELIFKTVYKPNKVYTSTMTSSMQSSVDFDGPEEKMAQLKSSGMQLPMQIDAINEVITITKTGSENADSSFPITIVYESMKSKYVMNGSETEKENPIVGLIVEGTYGSNNQMVIDTLISSTIDDNIRSVLRSTLESTQQLITFPAGPMRIGDEFEQKVPMSIPIAGVAPISIVIATTYKLIDIKQQFATFDITQAIELDMEIEQDNSIDASGSGTGVVEFDIENSYLTNYESDMTMTLKIVAGELKITSTNTIVSKQIVEIK